MMIQHNRLSRVLWTGVAIICSVCLFTLCPFQTSQPPADHGALRYDTLSLGVQESSLAVDELEPDRYAINVPSVARAEVMQSVEAESVAQVDGRPISIARHGFQGTGYLTNLPPATESALIIPLEIPASQHYDITICMAADTPVTNALRVNNSLVTNFKLEGDPNFVRVTFYGIYLNAGMATIAIDTIDAGIDVDYLTLTNDVSMDGTDFTIAPSLCNANASPEAKQLYGFLSKHWGKETIIGQYASDASNRELALIYEMTGQLPVIRFGELGTDSDLSQIEAAMDWHLYTGGVVGLMWQWHAPRGGSSVYAEQTTFNLSTALQEVDVDRLALLSTEEATQAVEAGTLPADCLLLLRDIDGVAASLRKLANMHIPVLWRPVHEAGGGWYWWGSSGAFTYGMLWSLVFNRLTTYHQLNNLIWIWNGQSASYLVPSDTYDIASVDVYLKPEMTYGSRYEQFLALANMTQNNKLLALSECSCLPSLEMMVRDHSIWSFFGLWYGEYIMNGNGTFSHEYYSSSDLYNLYNADRSMCLNDFLALCQ